MKAFQFSLTWHIWIIYIIPPPVYLHLPPTSPTAYLHFAYADVYKILSLRPASLVLLCAALLTSFVFISFMMPLLSLPGHQQRLNFFKSLWCSRPDRTAVPCQWGLGPWRVLSSPPPLCSAGGVTRCPRSFGQHTGGIIWGFVSRLCSWRATWRGSIFFSRWIWVTRKVPIHRFGMTEIVYVNRHPIKIFVPTHPRGVALIIP